MLKNLPIALFSLCSFCSFNTTEAVISEKEVLDVISRVQKNEDLNKALTIVSEAATASDDKTSTAGLTLLNLLLRKDKAFDEAASIAKEKVSSSKNSDKIEGLKLFCDLVDIYKKSTPEAIEAAQEAILSPDKEVKRNALTLYKILVNNNSALSQATKVAEEATHSLTDSYNFIEGLKLFIALVQQKSGFNEATTAVRTALATQNLAQAKEFEGYLIRLLLNLIENDKAFDEATKMAEKLATSKDI